MKIGCGPLIRGGFNATIALWPCLLVALLIFSFNRYAVLRMKEEILQLSGRRTLLIQKTRFLDQESRRVELLLEMGNDSQLLELLIMEYLLLLPDGMEAYWIPEEMHQC